MLHIRTLILLITLVALLPGCGSSPEPPPPVEAELEPSLMRFEYARVLMGSKARIVLYDESEEGAASKASAAFEEIAHLNAVMSDYDPASEAMRLVNMETKVWHPVSEDLLDILQKSARMWSISDGAFDPTIGPVTELWRTAMETGELPPADQLREARSHVGFNLIEIDADEKRVRLLTPGMVLDFGGIGKGYAADRALEILRGLGVSSALIDLGGDIAIGDPPPNEVGWSIEIAGGESPETRELSNVGIATSGAQFRFIEVSGVRYSHILDPKRGIGLTDPIGVTVIAGEAWVADALASAASVLGASRSDRLREANRDAEILFFEPSAGP